MRREDPPEGASVEARSAWLGSEGLEHSGSLAFLAAASRLLAESLDYEATLVSVAGLAMPHLGAWCIVDLLQPDGLIRRLAVLHPDPSKRASAKEIESHGPNANEHFGIARVLRTSQPEVVRGSAADFLQLNGMTKATREALLDLGSGTFVTVPMVARGRVLGAITFASSDAVFMVDEPRLLLAEDLARRCAMAIDNAWLYAEACRAQAAAENAEDKVRRIAAETTSANEQLVISAIREQEMLEEAETANRAKSEFLANMSHELRTPLNTIMLYADLLTLGDTEPLPDKKLSFVERIKSASGHLLSIIEDLLDLAKVEAGRLGVTAEIGSTLEALNAAIEIVTPQAEKAQLRVVRILPDSDLAYIGDPKRVLQILVNLLSNSVKFTDPGGTVTVSCSRHEGADPNGFEAPEGSWTVLAVRDTGIGIAEDKLAAVFQPFVQIEAGYTRRRQGTGLGLAIARELALRMNGNLTLESQLGVGSCFSLWLPSASMTDRNPASERLGPNA